MHKIYAIFLLTTLVVWSEGVTHTKWSRPIRNTHKNYNRERRQFVYGEWIPLTKPCPTCRPLVDPLDEGQKLDVSGLVPPRPPTVTRQIHGEGNFFRQDESSVLSAPPPPPILTRHPIAGSSASYQSLQFQNLNSFNSPLPIPSAQIYSQAQPIQFVPPSFLSNQNLLVNSNEPVLPVLPSSQNNAFGSNGQNGQFVSTGKIPNFDANFGSQKFAENVILEQNVRHLGPGNNPSSVFNIKPSPFPKQQPVLKQNSPQSFSQINIQQQPRRQQPVQHHPLKFDESILTPPPQPVINSTSQNLVLPGLEKEEIQLLYVPVETLRQRNRPQQQYHLQQQEQRESASLKPQNSEQKTESTTVTRSSTTTRSTEPTPTASTRTKGSFVTENSIIHEQTLSPVKLSSPNPFSTASTTSMFFHNLHNQANLHPFVSATPISSTESTYITPSEFTSKLVALTPETTFPHLNTVQSTIQYTTPGIQYVTTPKNFLTEDSLSEEIITGKPQFDNFETQKFPQAFAYQEQIHHGAHFQSLNSQQFQGSTRKPTSSFQYSQVIPQEQQTTVNDEDKESQSNFKAKSTQQNKYSQQLRTQEQEKELREQYLLQNQKDFELEQRRQNELNEQRTIQRQQKQKELEEQRRQKDIEEQRRQKDIEQQRYLQRQKEIERERILQQQRQQEIEEQRRLQRLQDAESLKLIKQKEKEEEEKQRLQWQKQQQQQKQLHQNNFRQEQQPQLFEKFQKEKQDNWKKQQLYQERQQQHQPQNHKTQSSNKNIFSEADNANFISQAEKELDNSHLVPHQPPLSVFYKGSVKSVPHITDVLKELRNSRSITVLDQYFEKMPKVFVGPAGLAAPHGYDKYELPYLSNIENRLQENQVNKLPFFVAPLNYAPPTGYSKIPFPSPHVGSVIISTESASDVMAKPTEANVIATTSEEEDEKSESYTLVGPELPGLINNLETERTTLKTTTTSSLPQTTAQLRNRRPSNNLYRPRKPVFRARSSTTTTTTTTTTVRPELLDEKFENPENGYRKPFNRFLKRRRQPTKSTTENILDYQSEKKSSQNRYYATQNQKQLSEYDSGRQKYENQDDDLPNSFLVRGDSPKVSSFSKYNQGKGLEKNRSQKEVPEENDNSFQSEEEGPFPTGSAKTLTHQLYKPNNVRTESDDKNKFSGDDDYVKPEPKVDTSTASANIYEIPETTQFLDELKVNSKEGYNQVSEVKTYPTYGEYTTIKEETSYSPLVTSLKYFGPTDYPKTETPIPSASLTPPLQQSFQTPTEYVTSDGFTSSYGEVPKFSTLSDSRESDEKYRSKSSEDQSLAPLSVELQAPLMDTIHQEKYTQRDYLEQKRPEPTQAYHYSDEYESGSAENSSSVEVVKTTSPVSVGSLYTTSYEDATPNFIKPPAPQTAALTTTEMSNFDSQKTFEASPLSAENFDYHSTISDVSSPKYDSLNAKTKSEESLKEFEDFSITTLPNFLKETTRPTGDQEGTQKIKLSNPSIVRVRTRVRGKQRGQIGHSTSDFDSATPFTVRFKAVTKSNDNTGEDYAETLDYNSKVPKYNFRGLNKSYKSTTKITKEAETEHKHISPYTVKPHKRPTNPSTVSTKRIRRPTTPIPYEQSSYETSTYAPETYSESEYPSSGVSNDVYYGQTSSSRPKYKKTNYFSQGLKDEVSEETYKLTTPTPSYGDEVPSGRQVEHYSKEEEPKTQENNSQELSQSRWPLTESSSNVEVTSYSSTTEALSTHVKETESTDVKKWQDSTKAFDPEINKKGGRRRVRVRVNKRPHENFETAESQNLRTVANILVPPTSTYKPKDESSFETAKNLEISQDKGSYKSYGFRSREYFKKRLNLTIPEINPSVEPTINGSVVQGPELNDKLLNGEKAHRGKFRGYVRKVIKYPNGRKDGERKFEYNTETGNFDGKRLNGEKHEWFQQNSFNGTARLPQTRHKTIVRYVKKNRNKTQYTQSAQHEDRESKKEEENQSESSLNFTPEKPKQDIEEFEPKVTIPVQYEVTSYEKENLVKPFKTTEDSESKEIEKPFETIDDSESKETEKPFKTVDNLETTEETENSETQAYVTEPEDNQQTMETETTPTEPTPTEPTPTRSTEFVSFIPEPSLTSSSRPAFLTKKTTKLYPVNQEPSSSSTTSSPLLALSSSKSSEDTYEFRKSETFGEKSSEERVAYKNKFYQTLRPVYQRAPNTGVLRLRESSDSQTTEQREKKTRFNKYKYGKVNLFGSTGSNQNVEEKKETNEPLSFQSNRSKSVFNHETKKYTRGEGKTRNEAFVPLYRNSYRAQNKTERAPATEKQKHETIENVEKLTDAKVKLEETMTLTETTTEYYKTTINENDESEESSEEFTTNRPTTLYADRTDSSTNKEEISQTTEDDRSDFETATDHSSELFDLLTTTTDSHTLTDSVTSTSEKTTSTTTHLPNIQPDLYRFAKNSFSFDETEKFTGTKNRAYVRNITADILENTSGFSGPGTERRNEIIVSSATTATDSSETNAETFYNKTEEPVTGDVVAEDDQTTEPTTVRTTGNGANAIETGNLVVVDAGNRTKSSKLVKTSTTTKISHETEICYRGRCIRTKSENPDEDLRLLVDSAVNEKNKIKS